MRTRSLPSPLTLYYLATPLFAVADYLLAIPVRVALGDGHLRLAYYVVVFGLGFLCRYAPRAAPWVGMIESASNLFLLVLAVLLPLWSGPETLLAGGDVSTEVIAERTLNLALAGTVFVVSFHRHRLAATDGVP